MMIQYKSPNRSAQLLLAFLGWSFAASAEDNVFAEEPSSEGTKTGETKSGEGKPGDPKTGEKREEGTARDPRSRRKPGEARGSESRAEEVRTDKDADADGKLVTFEPYATVEGYYSYNFNNPSNRVTAFRGFDSTHNSFALANAAIGGTAKARGFSGRLVLQYGLTGESYYGGEPTRTGALGAPTSNTGMWRYIQEALVKYETTSERKLSLEGGIMLSPIGPESIPVYDNWNFSRSTLFFALPFYHLGLRGRAELSSSVALFAMVVNGWNNIVDDNDGKTLMFGVSLKPKDGIEAQVLASSGIERSTGAAEGQYWRTDVDAWIKAEFDRVGLMAHLNGGVEPNRFGNSSFYSGALYGRFAITPELFVAARADRFVEFSASNASGTAAPIFLGGNRWVSSGTLTLQYRPIPQIDVRVELRRDWAQNPFFFEGDVPTPAVPNATAQTTALVGLIGKI